MSISLPERATAGYFDDAAASPVPLARPLDELRALLALAIPLSVANLAQVMIGAVDTAIVGRLGAVELGGAGLGNTLYFTVSVVGMGIMLGLDPLVAQAAGAREPDRSRRFKWQAVWLALFFALPLTVIVLLAGGLLERAGIEPAAAQAARQYLQGRVPGLVPCLLFVGFRSCLQAENTTRPIVVGALLANVVNLVVGWLLAFGDRGLIELGLPAVGMEAYGVRGAAWAGTLATVVQALVLALVLFRAPAHEPRSVRLFEPRLLLRALALGTPIGLQMLAEFGVFGVVTVLAGNIGSLSLAGHQVAITFASASFMIPVAIGAAASVRVGRAVGGGDGSAARRAGWMSIALGVLFMGFAALLFVIAPDALAAVVTDQPEVVAAAVPLLAVAAVFQLSDGAQAVALGALRGAGDTRFPLLANLAGHYLVGLPIGVLLAFHFDLGARGLWWGLSAGLTAVALGLILRFAELTSRPMTPAVGRGAL